MPIRLAFRAPKFVLENPVVYLSDEEPCVIYLNFILLLPHIGHTLFVGFSFAALERAKKQHTARPIEKKNANSTAQMPTHMHSPTIKIIPIIVNISCTPPHILTFRIVFWQATADAHSHAFDAQIVYLFFRVGHRCKPWIFWL